MDHEWTKNGPSKFCGRQLLKNLKWYGLVNHYPYWVALIILANKILAYHKYLTCFASFSLIVTEENLSITWEAIAENCELVGIYILSQLADIIDEWDYGFLQDDGLIILQNANDRKTDQARKFIIKIFEDGPKIEGKNLKIVGVTFNLINGTYGPCNISIDQLKRWFKPLIIKTLPE